LACGDALGRPVEFSSSGGIQREYGTLTEMVGYGTWNKPPGTVTDDTDQMLCIARSLKENGTFDAQDVSERFVGWYESGPFDIGNMTRDALQRLSGNEDSWKEIGKAVYEDLRTQPNSGAGNGSVMRCAPIAVAYSDDLDSLFHASVASSWITHADPRCTYGCALLNRVIAGLLREENGHAVDSAVEFCRERIDDEPGTDELFKPVQDVRELDASELSNSGYVVDTVQSSLYYALTADDFEDAVVDAVNSGGDTDTVGAVTGAVAGARFGASEVSERWTEEIDETEEISKLARNLSEGSYGKFHADLSY
jgi:ADP-ribosyl-[dinitrogen reductase] hydrolase